MILNHHPDFIIVLHLLVDVCIRSLTACAFRYNSRAFWNLLYFRCMIWLQADCLVHWFLHYNLDIVLILTLNRFLLIFLHINNFLLVILHMTYGESLKIICYLNLTLIFLTLNHLIWIKFLRIILRIVFVYRYDILLLNFLLI